MFINKYNDIHNIAPKVVTNKKNVIKSSEFNSLFGSEETANEYDLLSINNTNNIGNTKNLTGKTQDSGITAYNLHNNIHNHAYSSFKDFKKEEFDKLLNDSINENNVLEVLESYNKFNIYGKGFFKDLSSLPVDDRKYSEDIVKKIEIYCMKNNINADSIIAEFKSELNNADFKAVKLDSITNRLINRIKETNEIQNKPEKSKDPNGEIDSVYNQNKLNDCWFIATIKSAETNPETKKMLNDCITVNKDGSVVVTLKGVNRTYTISKEELSASNEFAKGDSDVRALELAANKYMHEVNNNKRKKCMNPNQFKDVTKDTCNRFEQLNNIRMADIEWGSAADGFRILFGNDNVKDIGPGLEKDFVNQYINNNNLIIVGRVNGTQPNYKNQDESVVINPSHAYSVLRADDKYVYLADPIKTSKEIKLTREEFLQAFNFAGVYKHK